MSINMLELSEAIILNDALAKGEESFDEYKRSKDLWLSAINSGEKNDSVLSVLRGDMDKKKAIYEQLNARLNEFFRRQ